MDMKHGKILTELTVPDDSITTMSTTKIISIEYRLQILFDMRARTGFLEGKNRRTVNKKLRGKITGKPGGFEVEVPVVIGTLYDSTHVPGTISNISSPGTISLAPSPASSSVRTLEHYVSSMHLPSSPKASHDAPATQHQASHSNLHSIPIVHGRQASEPVLGLGTIRGPIQPVRHHTAHYLPTPSAPMNLYQEAKELQPLPQIPYPPSPPMSPPSLSSSSNHTPSSSYQPPRLPYRENSTSSSTSSSSPISTTPNGYPNEKRLSMPHQLIPSPNSHVVAPTAPQAVSLGLGPASPGIYHRSVATPISTSGDYFQVVSKQPMGYGAFASSPVLTPPSVGPEYAYVPQTTYTPNASTSLPSHSRINNNSSSGGSSSMAPLRSPQLIHPPTPTPRNPHAVRPESFQSAPPYTPA